MFTIYTSSLNSHRDVHKKTGLIQHILGAHSIQYHTVDVCSIDSIPSFLKGHHIYPILGWKTLLIADYDEIQELEDMNSLSSFLSYFKDH